MKKNPTRKTNLTVFSARSSARPAFSRSAPRAHVVQAAPEGGALRVRHREPGKGRREGRRGEAQRAATRHAPQRRRVLGVVRADLQATKKGC